MKKNGKLALLLSLLLLVSTLASCDPTKEENSDAVSESMSETSEEIKRTEYLKADIDNLYTGKVDRSLTKTNLLKKKNYTVSYKAHEDYPDTADVLTDGTFADSCYGGTNKELWAGFYNRLNGDLTIEINLVTATADIADIGVSFCNNISMGIAIPDKVEFYIANGGEYKYLGTSTSPVRIEASDLYKAELKLQESVTATKIKIVCMHPRSTWLFIDEVFANKYQEGVTEGVHPDSYYGDIDIPVISESEYWSESDEDYNTPKNLLSGLTQQIYTLSALDGEHAKENYNTSVNSKILTDGIISKNATYSASQWFRFTRGIGREIYYDLGKTSAVSGYSFGFLKEKATGVYLPVSVIVSASENGKDWQTLKEIKSITASKDSDIVRVSGTFGGNYRARYIKIYIPVATHVYVDEIEITGTKKVGNAKTIIPDEEKQTDFPNKYAAPEDYNGTRDVLLSYICHPNVAPITKEIYLPHTAYIEDGVIKDTLFDSFMFLPYTAFLYEGSALRTLKKDDWQLYINTQFTEGKNMDALNEAVGETKAALGKDDYKASVFLSIFMPVSSQTSFGEINGRNLDFTKLADRKAAVKWLIDEQLRIFNSRGYENLYIQGFYWFIEGIDYSDSQIIELIDYTTDYVRSLGYITSWIPYYQASGYNEWDKLGFDLACYQPNFAFNFEVPDRRLYDAAASAKLLGMCIELEIGGVATGHVDRLKKYYAAGAETGFMTDAVHMYYQGGVPGSIYEAYKSNNAYLHSLYKDTYNFMKGKFNPSKPAAESTSVSCSSEEKANGKVSVVSDNMIKGFTLGISPKYGTVQLNSDGSFVYTPLYGIKGEDYFEISVDYGYGTSEPARITVNIE
ncbi:MAG: DUF4855 domain-containing protein [Eubacteriales bacterium]|nr:DUF4855 domain-containing protein [Eubacteriales bacterium]